MEQMRRDELEAENERKRQKQAENERFREMEEDERQREEEERRRLDDERNQMIPIEINDQDYSIMQAASGNLEENLQQEADRFYQESQMESPPEPEDDGQYHAEKGIADESDQERPYDKCKHCFNFPSYSAKHNLFASQM